MNTTAHAIRSQVIPDEWRGILKDENGCTVHMCFCKHLTEWSALECAQWQQFIREHEGRSNHVA